TTRIRGCEPDGHVPRVQLRGRGPRRRRPGSRHRARCHEPGGDLAEPVEPCRAQHLGQRRMFSPPNGKSLIAVTDTLIATTIASPPTAQAMRVAQRKAYLTLGVCSLSRACVRRV